MIHAFYLAYTRRDRTMPFCHAKSCIDSRRQYLVHNRDADLPDRRSDLFVLPVLAVWRPLEGVAGRCSGRHTWRTFVAGFGFDHTHYRCSQRGRRESGLKGLAPSMWAADALFLCGSWASWSFSRLGRIPKSKTSLLTVRISLYVCLCLSDAEQSGFFLKLKPICGYFYRLLLSLFLRYCSDLLQLLWLRSGFAHHKHSAYDFLSGL